MLLATPVVLLHGDIDSNSHDINEIENQYHAKAVRAQLDTEGLIEDLIEFCKGSKQAFFAVGGKL